MTLAAVKIITSGVSCFIFYFPNGLPVYARSFSAVFIA
jgi:hypothetical protein